MGNGKWLIVGNGKREMGNSRPWQMPNGQIADRRSPIADGRWPIADPRRSHIEMRHLK
jgi:hypothetical protein